MRPQLMSVMCSRPSMPPRSTNAPNSAMFLTMPLRRWPTSSSARSWAFFSARSASISARRLTTMFRRASSIFSTRHWMVSPDVVADVGRAADVDLAGRQEHVHADVDQQPALDLPRGHAGDDVALVDRLHHLQPGLDLFGLALAEGDHAAGVVHQAVDVFHVLDEDFDLGAGLGELLAFFPLVAEDDAFALVAHVDQHDVALDAEHAALDDLVQLHFLGSPGDFLGRRRPPARRSVRAAILLR